MGIRIKIHLIFLSKYCGGLSRTLSFFVFLKKKVRLSKKTPKKQKEDYAKEFNLGNENLMLTVI